MVLSAMPRAAKQTSRCILDAAYGLFYKKGFTRVSIDEIAEAAGITKRTLYYHFDSKDSLLASVLELQHELAMERVHKYDDQHKGSAKDIITKRFADVVTWSLTPDWTGSGFTRLAMELADMPGHPARTIAHQHMKDIEEWWSDRLKKADVRSHRERAREMVLLMQGAIALMFIHGDRKYADAAAQAALKLVRQGRQRSRKSRKAAA
jgi:AcrR family transcriptional regulator